MTVALQAFGREKLARIAGAQRNCDSAHVAAALRGARREIISRCARPAAKADFLHTFGFRDCG